MMKRLFMLMALALCLLALAFDAPPADATTSNITCNVDVLIDEIEVANANGPGPDTIELAPDCTYALSSPYVSLGLAGNYASWYGPSGLPAIASDITVEGNGATIERSSATGTPFRLLFVGADPTDPDTSNYATPGAGDLTLRDLTLRGGLGQGGDAIVGGGGGAGMGGAIFNQGEVTLERVTITNSTARGGNGGSGSGVGPGGGIGSDAGSTANSSGGGFGVGYIALGGGSGGFNSGGGGGFRAFDNGEAGIATLTGGNGGGPATGLGGRGGAAAGTPGMGGNGAGGGTPTSENGGNGGFGGDFGSGGVEGGGGGVGGGGATLDNGSGGGFGGVLRCGGYGLAMQVHTVKSPRHNRVYRYYRCPCHQSTRRGTCSAPVNVPAKRAEDAVWQFVTVLETEPGRILASLERRIECERRLFEADPEKEVGKLRRAIDATAAKRARFQDQQAHGLMTIDELRGRLEGLVEERARLERELEACANRGDNLRSLEEMRDDYAEAVKPGIDGFYMQNALADGQTVLRMNMLKETEGPRRRRRYEALRLEAKAVARDELELRGVFGSEILNISKTSSWPPSTPTTPQPQSHA